MKEMDFYKALEQASIETLMSNGFNMDLLNKNYRLSRMFFNTVRKYCNALPEDIKVELATEAFLSVFRKNYYVNFKMYSGSYCGREVVFENYANMLFKNALISASKIYCTQTKHNVSPTTSSNGDTFDILDYQNSGEQKVRTLSISNIEDREYYEESLQDLRDELKRLEPGSKDYHDIEKEIAYYQKRLDSIEQNVTPNFYEQDDGIFTVDEELSFCDIKDRIIQELEKTGVYDIKHGVTLELLCEGYTFNEIATYMKSTKRQVEKLINDIIVALFDLAYSDNSLMYALKNFTDNFTNFKLNREQDLVEFESTRGRIVEVLEIDVAKELGW